MQNEEIFNIMCHFCVNYSISDVCKFRCSVLACIEVPNATRVLMLLGIFYLEMKILLSFIHTHVVPNLCWLSPVEHKRKYLEKCGFCPYKGSKCLLPIFFKIVPQKREMFINHFVLYYNSLHFIKLFHSLYFNTFLIAFIFIFNQMQSYIKYTVFKFQFKVYI